MKIDVSSENVKRRRVAGIAVVDQSPTHTHPHPHTRSIRLWTRGKLGAR
jgi:hypothetical protein